MGSPWLVSTACRLLVVHAGRWASVRVKARFQRHGHDMSAISIWRSSSDQLAPLQLLMAMLVSSLQRSFLQSLDFRHIFPRLLMTVLCSCYYMLHICPSSILAHRPLPRPLPFLSHHSSTAATHDASSLSCQLHLVCILLLFSSLLRSRPLSSTQTLGSGFLPFLNLRRSFVPFGEHPPSDIRGVDSTSRLSRTGQWTNCSLCSLPHSQTLDLDKVGHSFPAFTLLVLALHTVW